MMKQLDLFTGTEHEKQRLVRRHLMHVCDAGEMDGVDSVRFRCSKCGLETDWLKEESITKAKRGIPCLKCNTGKLRVLHLNLKTKYWNDVNNGVKPEEYRLTTDYWRKRLGNGNRYDYVFIKLGYPKADDWSKILIFRWNGAKEKIIDHEEFDGRTRVFAIDLSKPVGLIPDS